MSVTTSSSNYQDHSLWDGLNDVLMEAMILLDPPPTTPCSSFTTDTAAATATTSASSLTLSNVQASYDMLVSFSNHDYFVNDLMSMSSNIVNVKNSQQQQNQQKQQHPEKFKANIDSSSSSSFTLFQDKIILLSDLYRAIIVSSSLLLEMTTPTYTLHDMCNDDNDNNGNNNDCDDDSVSSTIKILCQTIQRSILLLQRISQIYFLATDIDDTLNHTKSRTMRTTTSSSPYVPKNTNDKKQIILSMMKPYYQYQPTAAANTTTTTTTTAIDDINNQVKENNDENDNVIHVEWHDILLPKSQHPLLQECFERKELIDLETGVIFGYDDRLISLLLEDYEYNYHSSSGCDYDCDYNHIMKDPNYDLKSMDQNNEYNLSIKNNDTYHHQQPQQQQQTQQRQQQQSNNEQNHDISEHLSLSLNIKEIEKEEEMLLNVAFPDTYNDNNQSSNNHSKKNKKQKHGKDSSRKRRRNQEGLNASSGYWRDGYRAVDDDNRISHQYTTQLPSHFLDMCQENDILKYIQLPFTSHKDETYPIIKEGWLLLCQNSTSSSSSSSTDPTKKNDDDSMIKYYTRVFNNGIIVLCTTSMNESKHSSSAHIDTSQENLIVYELVVGDDDNFHIPKKCTSIIRNNVFHFQIESVKKKSDTATSTDDSGDENNNDVSNILTIEFAIDQEQGGNYLMEGWKWISVLDKCIETKAATQSLNKLIERCWS